MTGDPSVTSSSGDSRPPSSQGNITEAERYQEIRNSEGLAMKQLSWVMSHLKNAIGTKRPEGEPWEIERSMVERALNSLGIDEYVLKRSLTLLELTLSTVRMKQQLQQTSTMPFKTTRTRCIESNASAIYSRRPHKISKNT